MTALLVRDVLVTVLYLNHTTHLEAIDSRLTLLGTVIALVVGFMVNAAYGRWWEARTLWGQVGSSSRSLARQAVVLVHERGPGAGPGWPPAWPPPDRVRARPAHLPAGAAAAALTDAQGGPERIKNTPLPRCWATSRPAR